MKRQLLTGALAASTLTLAAFSQANPAHALSFGNGTVNLTASDINSTFQVNFNGNVGGSNVSGLSSVADFTFKGFTTVGTVTEAAFTVLLKNTSSISSRTSALGFDVLNRTLIGVGNPGGTGNTRVSGLFSNDRTGSFPNNFGNIEVCFTNGNTCQGAGNGGVTNLDPAGTLNLVLALNAANVTSLDLGNFGVRYQSINGGGFNGDSGTGRGTPIPTPALLPAVLGMGAAVLRKKKQEAKTSQEV